MLFRRQLLVVPFVILFTLSAFIFSPVFAQVSENEIEFNTAVVSHESGNTWAALEQVREFLIKNPDHHEAKSSECAFLVELKQLDEAETCLVDILTKHPDDLVNLSNLGNLYFLRGEYNSAKTQLEIAHKLEPENVLIHSNLLSARTMAGDNPEEIILEINELIDKGVNVANLFLTNAKLLNDKNQPGEARKLLEKIPISNNTSVKVFTQFGISYAKEGDFFNAEKYFLEGYSRNPTDPGLLKNLTMMYGDLGNRYFQLGDETNDPQHYKKSAEFYNLVLKYDPDNEVAKNKIVEIPDKIDSSLNVPSSIIVAIIFASGVIVFVSLHFYYRKQLNILKLNSNVPDKERKIRDIIFYELVCVFITGVLTIPLILVIISFKYTIQISDGQDVSNWATMVSEVVIGVTVAALILSYELSRQDKIDSKQTEITGLVNSSNKLIKNMKDTVFEIKRLENNQQKLVKEVQGFIKNENERIKKRKTRFGTTIHRDLSLIKDSYVTLENWIKKYQENPTPEQKPDIIRNIKNHGHNVKIYTDYILQYLPKIESDFDDPVLGTNIFNNCKKYSDLFFSIEDEIHWTSDGLDGMLQQIDVMKKILDRDIPRILKESI